MGRRVPGSDLSEVPAMGIGSAALDVRVAPGVFPGPSPLRVVEGLRARPAPWLGSVDPAESLPVVRGTSVAQQGARRPDRCSGARQGVQHLLDHRLDEGGVSELSANDARARALSP